MVKLSLATWEEGISSSLSVQGRLGTAHQDSRLTEKRLAEYERSYYCRSVSKGATTREAILQEGLALASRIGFEPLSIGALAKTVGMSKSGLYAHFLHKEDLQLAVLRKAEEVFIETVVRPALAVPRGEGRLRAIFEAWLEWAEADCIPGGCVFISAANEFDDRPGPLRDYLVGSQLRWLEGLACNATQAIEVGEFRADLDTSQFAYDFYAIALAYNHFRRLLDDPGARARTRAAFETLLAGARVSH
jgi:AcrR family transcriptional regulator